MSNALFCERTAKLGEYSIILFVTIKVAIKVNWVILANREAAAQEESRFHPWSVLIVVKVSTMAG